MLVARLNGRIVRRPKQACAVPQARELAQTPQPRKLAHAS